jgi:hypothetical protein
MASSKPTGYIRTIDRKGGPVFYAKLKLPDGSQPQPGSGRSGRSAHVHPRATSRAGWPRHGYRLSSPATTRS